MSRQGADVCYEFIQYPLYILPLESSLYIRYHVMAVLQQSVRKTVQTTNTYGFQFINIDINIYESKSLVWS